MRKKFLGTVSIQLMSPASGNNDMAIEWIRLEEDVSIQLMSPASGNDSRGSGIKRSDSRQREVSIQLMSPASGNSQSKNLVKSGEFPFN